MKCARYSVLLALCLSVNVASAQSNYTSYAESAFQTLQEFFNNTSGLWDTCGWWNGANCMTVIADLAAVDSSILASATSVFASTYTRAPPQNPSDELYKVSYPGIVRTFYEKAPFTSVNPGQNASARDNNPHSLDNLAPRAPAGGNPSGFLDSCYDDNSWWALAWIAAYDLTNNTDYLDTSIGIFGNLTAAWPTNCSNGGIPWCVTSTYINAIANELFLSVAAHLANRDTANSATYISWAQQEWDWFNAVHMINSEGTINDGLGSNCVGDTSATVWSYNQGVVLGGLVELNRASPNSSYIDAANAIAQAAIANLTDANHILHDVCEATDTCAPDGTQFKGIFVRNLAALQAVSPNDEYVQVIQANADSIWNNDRDASNNSLSVDWAGPFVSPVNASTHSSAMDALVAAIAVS
ncbi:MAG: hypothetical protein LQ340_006120 [Diploschistes diacapsis]|nr:MAG: hypothetical protein LQ340_006120 [Diploschistes diacapsis]